MRLVQWMVGILIFFFLLAPASADFYRYVDEHGNVLFTDDLSKVPPEQRASVQSYKADESPLLPEVKQETEESDDNAVTETTTERQKLLDQQNALNREYDDLMTERSNLDAEKDQAITQVQIKEYNKRIIEFNTRIKAYEEKRDALAREVKAFNDRIKAQQQQKSE